MNSAAGRKTITAFTAEMARMAASARAEIVAGSLAAASKAQVTNASAASSPAIAQYGLASDAPVRSSTRVEFSDSSSDRIAQVRLSRLHVAVVGGEVRLAPAMEGR